MRSKDCSQEKERLKNLGPDLVSTEARGGLLLLPSLGLSSREQEEGLAGHEVVCVDLEADGD